MMATHPGGETWRALPGREGIYEASDLGRVRSLRGAIPRILKQAPGSNGYLMVSLGRSARCLVHRLILEAFIGPSALQVNHKNLDRADNRLDNLEYVTCSDNHLHSYRSGTRKKHALTRSVRVLSSNGWRLFDSQLAAARHLGVSVGSVHSAIHRKHKVAGVTAEHA